MRTVRDADGRTYLLLKRSRESSRVRDPETGAERYVPNAELELVDGESPLETAAAAVPPAVRRVLTAARDDRAIGLLVELVDRGPLSVLEILDAYALCESELHGLFAEFRAAGLVEEVDVDGRRGYAATATTETAVGHLRDDATAEQ